jgi:hypothetical protein
VNIDDLKVQWSDVLNELEKSNRMAWIAYFDARIAGVDDKKILLDFSDVRKLSGALEYFQIRPSHREALERAIIEITGKALSVEELE